MFKQIARTVVGALQDPWVQGVIGLVLLARATNGMNQQLAALQESIRATHEMNSKAYMDWLENQKQARKPSPEYPPEDNSKPRSPVGEYFSQDANAE